MAYPTGVKIFIDGKDASWYVFGAEQFNPGPDRHSFRGINIMPYLRHISQGVPSTIAGQQVAKESVHTIEITAADGNGRVECRVEIR